MTETKAKYKTKRNLAVEILDEVDRVNKHGGKRTAGPGRKIGKPADIGTNGKMYADYLDIETIILLRAIHPIRSQAIRMAAKQYTF